MSKLLRSGFRRYVHSYIFWLAVIVTVGVAVVCGHEARHFYLEDFYVTIFLIASAVLISWIVGREHEEGVRNKVISGHTKGSIYVSELIMGVAVSVILYLLFAMIFLGMNSYIIGHAPNGIAIRIFLCGLLATACSASMIVTLSCMISHRAIVAIVNILLIFALIFGSETIDNMLNRPEYYEEYDYEYNEIVDEEGNIYIEMSAIEGSMRLVENPRYIKSPIRDILNIACRISPFTSIQKGGEVAYDWFGYNRKSSNSFGTSHEIWDNNADFSVTKEEMTTMNVLLIFSSVELIVVSCAGYFFFRKKELK